MFPEEEVVMCLVLISDVALKIMWFHTQKLFSVMLGKQFPFNLLIIIGSAYRRCMSFARKCEKTAHPVTTAVRRYGSCLKSPLKSVLSTSTHHNSKTIELLP